MDQPPAALPRALDVQRFAGAREQEIRALCDSLKGSRLGAKFGVAALPRHLRRRAGSHKPYHAHRFRPNLKLQGKRRKMSPTEQTAEDGLGSRAVGGAAQLPPTQLGEGEGGMTAAASARPFTNRRMRRQPALLQQQHRESAAWTEKSLAGSSEEASSSMDVDAAGGSASSSSVRRLETHVWHAKRLAMEERYGWLLPAGAAGQGRGSRSFIHAAKASALMHDASYLCPLLLSGPWRSMHSVLSTLLDPAASAILSEAWDAAGGSSGGSTGWEHEVTLHQPGRFPLGAICPAQLLLCPSSSSSASQAMEVDAGVRGNAAPAAAQGSAAESSANMQACLWVHPAAAAEAYAAVKQAAAGHSSSQVSLCVLNVRKIELRGGASDAALAVALAGSTAAGGLAKGGSSDGSSQPAGSAAPQQQQQQPLPAALADMQHGDAVQVLLPDPRLRKAVALGAASATLLPEDPDGSSRPASNLSREPIDLQDLLRTPLPLSEADVSSRRQHLRRRMLQLDASAGSAAAGTQQQQQQEEEEEEEEEDQGQELRRRGYCPALVVRHDPPEDCGIPGWSLVLPSGWVPPFWLAAAYAGCRPVGQREWRWLHTLQQRRCFPWDYPDTAAYASLMQQQLLRRGVAAARRPKGKQMLAAPPCPPDWHQVVQAWQGNLSSGSGPAGAAQPAVQQQQDQQQQPMELDAGAAEAAPSEADVLALEAAGAALSGPANGSSSSSRSAACQLYVARRYSMMSDAVVGDGSRSSSSTASGSTAAVPAEDGRPLAAALRQGLLQWRPRQKPGTTAHASSNAASSRSCCLLEATVQPIKTGTAAEGAAVCLVLGREADRYRTPVTVLSSKQQRRRQREAREAIAALAGAGGDPAEALAVRSSYGNGSSSGGTIEVPEEAVQVIGYVLSEAPRGAPRRCASLAAMVAAPAWRLRSLQYWEPRQDGGAIEAFVRSPGSATLFPVRLRLLAELEA